MVIHNTNNACVNLFLYKAREGLVYMYKKVHMYTYIRIITRLNRPGPPFLWNNVACVCSLNGKARYKAIACVDMYFVCLYAL